MEDPPQPRGPPMLLQREGRLVLMRDTQPHLPTPPVRLRKHSAIRTSFLAETCLAFGRTLQIVGHWSTTAGAVLELILMQPQGQEDMCRR